MPVSAPLVDMIRSHVALPVMSLVYSSVTSKAVQPPKQAPIVVLIAHRATTCGEKS